MEEDSILEEKLDISSNFCSIKKLWNDFTCLLLDKAWRFTSYLHESESLWFPLDSKPTIEEVKKLELGIASSFNDIVGRNLTFTINILKKIGFKWLRVKFPMEIIGKDFYPTDRLLKLARRKKIKILPLFHTTTGKALKANFFSFVKRAVERYKDYINTWCLWNEPNYYLFWSAGYSQFSKFFQNLSKMVKELDSNLRIVLNIGWVKGLEFLVSLHKRKALKNVDIISLHGYPETYEFAKPEDWSKRIYKTINLLKFLKEEKELWVDECGFYAFTGLLEKITYRNPSTQLSYLIRSVEAIAKTKQVKIAFLFCLRDPFPSDLSGIQKLQPFEYYFGLFKRDWTPKHKDTIEVLKSLSRKFG